MNLLVTGAWSGAKNSLDALREMGHTVLFQQQEADALPCAYEWVEGVICNGLFQSHPIEKFENLRYIQLTSAGFDRVPMEYVKEHGIEIHNAKGVYSIPMAEFALAGVLQIYKQSRFFEENQKAHRWNKHRGLLELYGKTVTIVGCGEVGRECAKRFEAFGCRVLGVNRTVRETAHIEKVYGLEDLTAVLGRSDIVVLTIALTEETRSCISAEVFAAMPTGAVLVNISRGAVVEETALLAWLRSGRAGGAVLDVFEQEPLPAESPLWEMEQVILSPHNSFVGDGNEERIAERIFRMINRIEKEDGI